MGTKIQCAIKFSACSVETCMAGSTCKTDGAFAGLANPRVRWIGFPGGFLVNCIWIWRSLSLQDLMGRTGRTRLLVYHVATPA